MYLKIFFSKNLITIPVLIWYIRFYCFLNIVLELIIRSNITPQCYNIIFVKDGYLIRYSKVWRIFRNVHLDYIRWVKDQTGWVRIDDSVNTYDIDIFFFWHHSPTHQRWTCDYHLFSPWHPYVMQKDWEPLEWL